MSRQKVEIPAEALCMHFAKSRVLLSALRNLLVRVGVIASAGRYFGKILVLEEGLNFL